MIYRQCGGTRSSSVRIRTLSPKFNRPTASPPRTTVKCSHERNVRSLAKATLGSTRTGNAMRFAAVRWRRGWVDIWLRGNPRCAHERAFRSLHKFYNDFFTGRLSRRVRKSARDGYRDTREGGTETFVRTTPLMVCRPSFSVCPGGW